MHETCPHCGKLSNEESSRFCSGCGARMDGSTPDGYPGGTGPVKELKNSSIAGSCSSVIPGLGQVYNGETVKGFVLFTLTLLGLCLLLLPGLVVWLYAMYDAWSVAGKMNTGEIGFRETSVAHMILFIVFAMVAIVAVLVVIITLAMASLVTWSGPVGLGDYRWMFGKKGLF
jgi:TM2 domain-containing membrane protein YozV